MRDTTGAGGADPWIDYVYELEHPEATVRQYEWRGIQRLVVHLCPLTAETQWLDFGCGNGFYTLPMAKQVGPNGKVLAVDIQPEMIQMLKERAANAGIDNIEPILSTEKETKLPENQVDLLILVDVYHEFSFPSQMLAGIRKSLKDDGVVALLEFRAEDPTVPIRPLHKMSKKQIMKEYEANGFKLVREFDGLPWQHLMYFGRDNEWKKGKASSAEKKANDEPNSDK